MPDPQPLPITILTGFLGSGKTTVLKRALGSLTLADTAVLINEIGEIGLDHYLVETVDGPIFALPGGCVCCAVREDLAQTLRRLIDRRDRGIGAPFRRIVLETTGLAEPAPILFTLGADPVLDRRVRLERIITTVDAVAAAATLERFAEARQQVAVADRILVTKTDLAPFDARLSRRLAALNPEAGWQIADGVSMEDIFSGPTKAPARPIFGPVSHHHSEGIATYALVLNRRCSRLEFAQALGALVRERGADLLRWKGLVTFSDRSERPAFVQGAQHALYPPIWLERWPDEDRRSRLVFIVERIPREDILACFAFASAAPLEPRS